MADTRQPGAGQRVVAMRYHQDHDRAPRVVAKGAGSVADRILELAREHGVPLFEDRDLVELLSVLELDAEIPSNLYGALAEVLAHVYRVNRQLGGD